jgi:hypothetical protein
MASPCAAVVAGHDFARLTSRHVREVLAANFNRFASSQQPPSILMTILVPASDSSLSESCCEEAGFADANGLPKACSALQMK